MRIALVSVHYGPPWNEGVRNMARCVVQFLEARGDEVVVISPRLLSGGRRLRRWLLTLPFVGSLAFNVLAAGYARRVSADVVVLFASISPALGLRARLLRRAAAAPLVLYITGLRATTLGYRLLLEADRVVVNSPFLSRFFPDADVVPPCIAPLPLVPRERPAPSPHTVLFLGAFERCRGVEDLVRAMAHLDGHVDATLILAWNGVGRRRYRRILRAVRAAGVEDRVRVVQDGSAADLYARADVVVIPRRSPRRMAFPLRIVEAVTSGVPLVVTRINGMDQLVDGCGLAVPPRDARALAAAIERILTDRDLYRRLVEGCRRRARELDPTASLERLYGCLTTRR